MRAIMIGLLLAATAAAADEAQIRKVVEAKLGGVKVEGVQPGPLVGRRHAHRLYRRQRDAHLPRQDL